jgi:hypothetical protein
MRTNDIKNALSATGISAVIWQKMLTAILVYRSTMKDKMPRGNASK